MERIVTGKLPYMVTMYPEPKSKLEIWAINGSITTLIALLKLSAFDIETGKVVPLPEKDKERKVELKPNQTTEIGSLSIPHADTTVIAAYLDDPQTGERLARWVDWPQPLKFVHFSKTPNVTSQMESSGDIVNISSEAPIKGIMLGVPIAEGGADATWDDNFIDLVPGERIRVHVDGLSGRKIETRWLCDWENEEGFEL